MNYSLSPQRLMHLLPLCCTKDFKVVSDIMNHLLLTKSVPFLLENFSTCLYSWMAVMGFDLGAGL